MKIFKRLLLLFVFTLFSIFMLQGREHGSDLLDADTVFHEAQILENDTQYTKAYAQYNLCHKLFTNLKQADKARQCILSVHRIDRIRAEYPYTESDILSVLAKKFQFVPEKERLTWIKEGRLDHIEFDGKVHYYEYFYKNLLYRNLTLFHQYSERNPSKIPSFVIQLHDLVMGEYDDIFTPYINPKRFLLKGQMEFLRTELPKEGILQLWIPIPIETAAQQDLEIIHAEPHNYLKSTSSPNADLGLLYFEIPLETLRTDLRIEIQVKFTRYQQQFDIDPSLLTAYEKDSDLYRTFTRSYANTLITPEIQKKAEAIIGETTNPYFAAQKIYSTVINTIDYSFMPHLTLAELKQPESIYVHTHSYGDCGAQSLYFTALCRAVGIPARTTGGWQLVPGLEGPHFWSEIYLPPYGWVPVDTTVAETADWDVHLSSEENQVFKEYFFTHLDPYRMVIQNDIDIPLSPAPLEAVSYLIAIQAPAASCRSSDKDIDLLVKLRWKFNITAIEALPEDIK